MKKTTNQDKVNHYVNNLAQYISFWEIDFLDLHNKVQEVKNDPKFHEFCIKKFDEWKIQVKILYDYFK